MNRISLPLLFLLALLSGCGQSGSKTAPKQAIEAQEARIISLKGAVSEVLVNLGLEEQIVGTDVTSTYPPSLARLPKVGHNRNISTEGILALEPTLIIGTRSDLSPATIEQLQGTGTPLLLLEHPNTVTGTRHLIRTLADTLGEPELGTHLINNIEAQLAQVQELPYAPKVLFIYARGAGTMMVAGAETPMQSIIELAGGQNAISGFTGFKPLTTEALIAANPDAVLLFNSGLSSLNGKEGVLAMPGMAQTTAGKFGHVIAMEGAYLSGFGPRLGEAVLELNRQFHSITQRPTTAHAH